jgi:SWI/SNF-related matrix-associated actin-dependent regulator 1 of chromatin subfamily A
VANHPLLVRHRYDNAAVEEIISLTHARGIFGADAPLKKVREHVESLSDFALHALCGEPRLRNALAHRRLPPDAALDSGKSRRLATLLPALQGAGSRPLIFSQWKIMLDVLEWVLATLGLSYYRLDGSTPVR